MLHDKNHVLKQLSVIYLSTLRIFEGKALKFCYVQEYYVLETHLIKFIGFFL